MSRPDNTVHLRRAAAARHAVTVDRARAAMAELARNACPVTVAGVAVAAGVSRSWIYEQPDLLAEITRLRDRAASTTPVPAAQRATDASLRQRLDTARAEIEHLRADNATLRDQLARALGERRTLH